MREGGGDGGGGDAVVFEVDEAGGLEAGEDGAGGGGFGVWVAVEEGGEVDKLGGWLEWEIVERNWGCVLGYQGRPWRLLILLWILPF